MIPDCDTWAARKSLRAISGAHPALFFGTPPGRTLQKPWQCLLVMGCMSFRPNKICALLHLFAIPQTSRHFFSRQTLPGRAIGPHNSVFVLVPGREFPGRFRVRVPSTRTWYLKGRTQAVRRDGAPGSPKTANSKVGHDSNDGVSNNPDDNRGNDDDNNGDGTNI